jgi:rod shape-determining protein MreD
MRSSALLFWFAIAAAQLFALLPGPGWLIAVKPLMLALVLIYFAMEQPEHVGVGTAFLIGLCADLLSGALLGEQALRCAVLVYLVLRFRQRLRFFPLAQQTAGVLALLVNDRVIALWIQLMAGFSLPAGNQWLDLASSTLLWPWLFLTLDRLRYRQRPSHAGHR